MSVRPMRLLEAWEPPDAAGEPVACLATTFTFDPDFFEQECLSRFLGLDTPATGTGRSLDEINYVAQCEQALNEVRATVIVDRSNLAAGRSQRWDVLSASAPAGGVQHAKVSALIWQQLTRVVIASANLTPAGYRDNIEVAWVIDLPNDDPYGPLVRDVARFLDRVVKDHVAGTDTAPSPRARALETVRELAARATAHRDRPARRGDAKVAVVHTLRRASLVEQAFDQAWNCSASPTAVTVASPYWLSQRADGGALGLAAVQSTLTKRGAVTCNIAVAATDVVDAVRLEAPAEIAQATTRGAVTFLRWPRTGAEIDRTLHAKIVRWERPGQWVMAMAGSANCTGAGYGLRGSAKNIELAVVVGDKPEGVTGRALRDWLRFPPIPEPWTFTDGDLAESDERADAPVLPLAFEEAIWDPIADCILVTVGAAALPTQWQIAAPNANVNAWFASDVDEVPGQLVRQLDGAPPPLALVVTWFDGDGVECAADLVVNAADRSAIPAPPELRDLALDDLLELLAAGGRIHAAIPRIVERRSDAAPESTPSGVMDPHAKVDTSGFVLQRVRRVAHALEALQQELSRPITSVEALRARLRGPYSPLALARCIAADPALERSPTERSFFLVELVRTLRTCAWGPAGELPAGARASEVEATVAEIEALIPASHRRKGSYVAKVLAEGDRG